jgi:RecJ-like exonuclease
MARCNDCNKFVSYGDPEFTVNLDATVNDEGIEVTGDIEMQLTCAECAGTLKSTTFDVCEQVGDEKFLIGSKTHFKRGEWEKKSEDMSVDMNDNEPEGTERSEGKGRYAKKFYGYEMTVDLTVTFGEDEAVASVTLKDDCQASSFDEY